MKTGFDSRNAEEASPVVLAVVGGSGSGKSWLARRLADLAPVPTAVVCQDSFYKDLSHLPAEARPLVNFDHPNALDWVRLRKCLAHLATGRSARVPIYDFTTHSRRSEEQLLEPAPLVIVEGLWLLHRPALQRFFTLTIYLDATSALCLERRIARDVAERGRAKDEVAAWYASRVLPMQQKFVEPQRCQADVVLCSPPREEEIAALAQRISSLVGGKYE